MTHVYDVLQRWIDAQRIPPTQAQLARLLGVSRGTVTNWKTGTVPKPAQIDTIVERTGIPKSDLLTAVLRDQGYLHVDTWGEATDDGPPIAGGGEVRRPRPSVDPGEEARGVRAPRLRRIDGRGPDQS